MTPQKSFREEMEEAAEKIAEHSLNNTHSRIAEYSTRNTNEFDCAKMGIEAGFLKAIEMLESEEAENQEIVHGRDWADWLREKMR